MSQIPHIERHFTGSEVVRDIVIGMSNGLTVPFALAAGLSGIANSTAIVITGGLAEIAAGSIAMPWGATWQRLWPWDWPKPFQSERQLVRYNSSTG